MQLKDIQLWSKPGLHPPYLETLDLHVTSDLVKNHFQQKTSIPQKTVGRGGFLKICRDTMYAKYW